MLATWRSAVESAMTSDSAISRLGLTLHQQSGDFDFASSQLVVRLAHTLSVRGGKALCNRLIEGEHLPGGKRRGRRRGAHAAASLSKACIPGRLQLGKCSRPDLRGPQRIPGLHGTVHAHGLLVSAVTSNNVCECPRTFAHLGVGVAAVSRLIAA